MESGELAAAIGLIILSTNIATPVEAQGSDILKGLVGAIANTTIERGTQGATTAAKPQNAATTRDETRRTQQALNRNGYPAGPADGIAGKQTRAAIRAYQLDNGWPATGTLTAAQRAQLFGHVDPGAAAIASGLVPLLLDDRGGSAAGNADILQERKNSSASTGRDLDDGATDEITTRRQQRLSTNDRGTAPTGDTNNAETTATATGNDDHAPGNVAGTSQQALRSLLSNSAQQTTGDNSSTTDGDRAKTRTTTSVDGATQTRQARRTNRTNVAAGSGVGAGNRAATADGAGDRAATGDSATEGGCAGASRRTGRCEPSR